MSKKTEALATPRVQPSPSSTRIRRRSSALVAVVAIAGITLMGCTSGGGNGNNGGGTGVSEPTIDTLRVPWGTDPRTFDPALVSSFEDYRVATLSYDTVVRLDDNGIVPGIAESWETTGSSVKLTIRDGLTCEDGTAITATVVGDSLRRLANPETGSTIAPLIFGSVNFAAGGIDVTADDNAGTVQIDLNNAPYSELLVGLTVPAAGIICPAGLADPEGLNAGTVKGSESGPYLLSERTTGVAYTYELREDYDNWPEYSVPLEGVPAKTLWFSVGTLDAAPNQLMTGELDAALVTAENISRFETDPWSITQIPIGDFFIIFNQTETSPFKDRDLRVAVAQAIDPDSFIDSVNPRNERSLAPADPSVLCVNEDPSILIQKDVDAAKKVLTGVKIRLIGSNTAGGANGVGNINLQEQLRAAGAEVELANVDNGTWITTILGPDTGSWDMTLFASLNNVGTLVTGLTRGFGTSVDDGGRNISRSDNPVAVDAFNEAMAADNDETKCEAYQRAQAAVMQDEVSIVPLSTNVVTYVTSEKVSLRAPGGRESITNLRIIG